MTINKGIANHNSLLKQLTRSKTRYRLFYTHLKLDIKSYFKNKTQIIKFRINSKTDLNINW